jgi:very-short-patch-repair endonuclease
VDGGQHGINIAYDDARTRWLENQGFSVIRFWNDDVLQSTEGVVDPIAARMEARLATLSRNVDAPSPCPSREGRGI